jgi:hypothetical protein
VKGEGNKNVKPKIPLQSENLRDIRIKSKVEKKPRSKTPPSYALPFLGSPIGTVSEAGL